MNRISGKSPFGNTGKNNPDRFRITKSAKTEAQAYREARAAAAVGRALRREKAFACFAEETWRLARKREAAAFARAYEENVPQKAFISCNGAMRVRPLAELAERGELWLEDDGGKRLSITERNFHLLYRSRKYNTLCLRLGERTLRFKRDIRIAGLFWEAA